jgi:hypothetical protein
MGVRLGLFLVLLLLLIAGCAGGASRGSNGGGGQPPLPPPSQSNGSVPCDKYPSLKQQQECMNAALHPTTATTPNPDADCIARAQDQKAVDKCIANIPGLSAP